MTDLYVRLISILMLFPLPFIGLSNEADIFIRVNQLGFLPSDIKTAVILSSAELEGKQFSIVKYDGNGYVFDGIIPNSSGGFGNFDFSYRIDFSEFSSPGRYYISIGNVKSYDFYIDKNTYVDLTGELLSFFKLQRCGYTNPMHHAVCHKADATSLIEDGSQLNKQIDVTGGWHDAGDYVKFLNTTSVATYTLLFSFDFDTKNFSFDKDGNDLPDILEEAKIGLDWMLRSYFADSKFITQVQDGRDQEVGWRMPENDPLGFDRPGFVGMGKNLIGIYSATMALASRIWKNTIHYDEFADQCLKAAEFLYSIKDSVRDIDSSGTGRYLDKNYLGKLALGAVELYLSTGKVSYLNDAKKYADAAGSDYWWSYGDINSFAHYRLAKFDLKYAQFIENNLKTFSSNKDTNLFGNGASFSWGTNNTLLGIALQCILWKKITGDSAFDTLAAYQRDFVLGKNQWGMSFVTGAGKSFPNNLHHQVLYLGKKKITGIVSAGPVPKDMYKDYKITFKEKDRLSNFQTDDAVYYDDRNDYLSNEPSIILNATALFVIGNQGF